MVRVIVVRKLWFIKVKERFLEKIVNRYNMLNEVDD